MLSKLKDESLQTAFQERLLLPKAPLMLVAVDSPVFFFSFVLQLIATAVKSYLFSIAWLLTEVERLSKLEKGVGTEARTMLNIKVIQEVTKAEVSQVGFFSLL